MRNLLAFLLFVPSLCHAQNDCQLLGTAHPCCYAATSCSTCDDIAACHEIEVQAGETPETFAGLLAQGDFDAISIPCSTWWKNTDEVITDIPQSTCHLGGSLTFSAQSGCTFTEACNYNPLATVDDGSCLFFDECHLGCTDPDALNFNDFATTDDGSCWSATETELCDIPLAFYSPYLTWSEYSTFLSFPCAYPAPSAVEIANTVVASRGEVAWGIAHDSDYTTILFSIWDENCSDYIFEMVAINYCGCSDPEACNYDALAEYPSGCLYPAECETCSGATDGTGTIINNDTDYDGVCDDEEVLGCTNPEACNYDPFATEEAGSCNFGCEFCGAGTTWDGTLQQCISLAPPSTPACGEGTIWDPVNEECIVANPTDTDFDGCVTAGDVLNLLAAFGTCPPLPEWPNEPIEDIWTCGASLTYWDYDYATVLIGDQCWFAENLQTALYHDGSAIPAGLSEGEWSSATSGAQSVFGEGESLCSASGDIFEACDDAQSLVEYGRLYNWYAVYDARGLCPSGWHVPTDGEWTVVTDVLGGESVAGGQMKTTYGWYNGGNGTNSSGFSGLPGGTRGDNGTFDSAGFSSRWWSSSLSGSFARYRYLQTNYESIARSGYLPNFGFSVRCNQD